MLIYQRSYRFRMEPSSIQAQQLLQFAGARRFVWNWALDRKQSHYREHGTSLTFSSLCEELTNLKQQPETAWLRDIDSQALQQALRDLEQAFKNFFERRARYPRYKSKKRDIPTFRIPQRVTIGDGYVVVPKVGHVRVRQHRAIHGQTKSATFKRDTTGHWYVMLVVTFELPDAPLPDPHPDTTVGLDAGLKDFAVLSTGERTPAPRFYRRAERTLRRAQRSVSRKQKGSRNRTKALRRLAYVHRRVAQQRADFLHKLSHRLIRQHQTICIENLDVKALARSKLSKSFADASHGLFRFMLTYKALWYQRQLAVIDRWYPSSRLCGFCGIINTELDLKDRIWTCPCGAVHDRDVNAAINIKHEGLRMLTAG